MSISTSVGRTSTTNVIMRSLVTVILFAGALICARPELLPTDQESHFKKLLKELIDRQQSAIDLATQYRTTYPTDPSGRWMLAEALTQSGDHLGAIDEYRSLPQDSSEWEFQREFGLGKRYFALGRLAEAEASFRRATKLDPWHLEANERLGHLLQICGRTWESAPYFLIQIQRGKCRGDELLAVSCSERFFRFDERLERMSESGDPFLLPIRIGEARRAIFENREAEAEAILRTVIATYPQYGEAQGRLGRIIVERGDLAEFARWRSQLPEEARNHPEVLFVEGLQAKRLGQLHGATYCFLETLKRSPDHLGASLQIAGCFNRLNLPHFAQRFAERAELISSLEQSYNLQRGDFQEDRGFRVIEILDALGRNWEAAGWCFVMSRFDQPPAQARTELNRRLKQISKMPDSSAGDRLPLQGLCRDDFSAPQFPLEIAPAIPTSHSVTETTAWNFTNDAERMGIHHTYFEGTDEPNRLSHIINVMGGGLGAIDFDQDGWPDLYLAQANNWRDPSPQLQWFDRLFRNQLGTGFTDVTIPAGLREIGFSHGVAAGDYNQDGFPDVYIGNLGPNTLYRNNGDGTFQDVTVEADVGGNEWTTSSAFADVTGDGLPDLFVANYTRLQETRDKECPNSEGNPKACTPDVLPAEFDRCYVNRGDGTFFDTSHESGIRVPDGKGLGIVVSDFEENGRLSLFVANDTTPNFLFLHRGVTDAGIPQFDEEALVRGVAYDQDGNAQANMGIASGDINGDGRLDLFITTFFNDSKTLQVGQGNGFFSDLTRPFRLRDPGFLMNGFGCQFADFDGDRWEDLVTTNGHVDQRTSIGSEDRMPPQLYRNVRGERFEEVAASELGDFFQGKYLGRGLAIFDWNRDGKTDLGISHLHAPFALLTNRTANTGLPLVVRLVGTRGCRDPIGAKVIARVGHESVYRFLTAGDGFLVTNERRLHFSWPTIRQLDQLIVRWPDGHEDSWNDVEMGQEILVIEGRSHPIQLKDLNPVDSTNN